MNRDEKRAFRERVDGLKHRMAGRWMAMIAWSAPCLYEAAEYLGRTTLCPMHEEKASFRFFHDSNDTGAGYCPICGHFGDGIAVLRWVNDMCFYEVIDMIEVWLYDYEAEIRLGRRDRRASEKYRLPRTPPPILMKRRTARMPGTMD